MTVQAGLVSFLADLATLYPVVAPAEAAYPFVTYQVISSVSDETHDGPLALATTRIQLTVHASGYLEALELSRDLYSRLAGYRGALGTAATVNYISAERPHDVGYQPEEDSWQMVLDALIQHTED